MKIQIEKTTEKDIIQITTVDERWYQKLDAKGIPIPDLFVPSVTWITGYYPKGIQFYKWLADKGWNEAERIKIEAGDKGTRVHKAIDQLIHGKELKMKDKFVNFDGTEEDELNVEEWEAVMSFVDWFNLTKPKVLASEFVIFSEKYGYAGTVDLKLEIDGKVFVVDLKTSKSIWPSHGIQISAYRQALEEHGEKIDGIAILQVGYKMNKRGYKFTELDYNFDLFLSARKFWEEENKNVKPKQKDYPMTLSIKNLLTK